MASSEEKIYETLENTEALLNGHFVLRSGLHSDRYFQAALALQYPETAEFLCRELVEKLPPLEITTVLSPAVGGIVLGQELARLLEARAVFAEKTEGGALELRRGFQLSRGEKVLIAEDVITKGGRVSQTVNLAEFNGAEVQHVAVLVDRSGGASEFQYPMTSLVQLSLNVYDPDDCPLCKKGQPFN